MTHSLSPRLKINELETAVTILYMYKKKILIPLTYIPVPRGPTSDWWMWRVFIGNRFCGEFSIWISYYLQGRPASMSQRPGGSGEYKERPRIREHLKGHRYGKFEQKKISRALNVLEFGSPRYKPEKLIRVIKKHCGVDATLLYHTPKRR